MSIAEFYIEYGLDPSDPNHMDQFLADQAAGIDCDYYGVSSGGNGGAHAGDWQPEVGVLRRCVGCSRAQPKAAFSKTQWAKGASASRCKACVGGDGGGTAVGVPSGASAPGAAAMLCHRCSECGCNRPKTSFSKTQLAKAVALRRCVDCCDVGSKGAKRGLDIDSAGGASASASKRARSGAGEGAMQQLKMYHGTSWEAAKRISRDGFKSSVGGCLGAGVYVAQEHKARRFAANGARHGGSRGGLVTVIISFSRAKYVSTDDLGWQAEGFDACRTDSTSASGNMEWCVKSSAQVRVLSVQPVALEIGADDGPVEEIEAAYGDTAWRDHEQMREKESPAGYLFCCSSQTLRHGMKSPS